MEYGKASFAAKPPVAPVAAKRKASAGKGKAAPVGQAAEDQPGQET